MNRSEELVVAVPPGPVPPFEALYTAEYGPMVRLAFLLVRTGGHAEALPRCLWRAA